MDIAEKIIAQLREQYNPSGIILHGSRATGKENPHSDWDLYVLVHDQIKQLSHGGMMEGQNLDPHVVVLPIADDQIIDQFNSSLRHCRILFDADGSALDLVNRAKKIYEKGRHLTAVELENRKNFMTRCMGRLEDNSDNPGVFFLRLGRDFYGRSIDWWFMILHNEFSQPAYSALEEIEARDAEYFGWLSIISGDYPNQEKLEAARKIYFRLFNQ